MAFMFRELQLLQNREEMATQLGVTISMGLEGRTEMDIGNGWVEHVRPDGKQFYVNNDTGKRTWVRPKEEGVMEKSEFDRCEGLVSKLTYEGRFPKDLETKVADAGDCNAFLERLYSANETKFKREIPAGSASAPTPAFAGPAGTTLNSEDRYIPSASA